MQIHSTNIKMYESGAVILTIENAGGIVAGFTRVKNRN